jgi:hypothetical protein
MEVLGSAPPWAPAGIGALAWPVPVRSPGPPGSAADRRSAPLSALAEKSFERVVRLAAPALDTPWASVTVPGKRCSSMRTCPASTRAEAHRETRPSVNMAARNQSLLDWPTADPRFLTAVHVVTLALKGSRHETGRPARVRGRLAGRSVTAAQADNTHSSGSRDSPDAAANHDAVRSAGDGSCFRRQRAILMPNRPVRPTVRW